MPPIALEDVAKTLLLGCGGAVAYYFLVSYVFRLVIYPTYRKVADFLLHESIKPEARIKTDRYLSLLRAFRLGLSFLMGITWWLLFGGCVYVLYSLLAYYFTVQHAAFGWLFGLAVLLPAIWALWNFIGFFKQKPPLPITWKMDTRPLFDQMLED